MITGWSIELRDCFGYWARRRFGAIENHIALWGEKLVLHSCKHTQRAIESTCLRHSRLGKVAFWQAELFSWTHCHLTINSSLESFLLAFDTSLVFGTWKKYKTASDTSASENCSSGSSPFWVPRKMTLTMYSKLAYWFRGKSTFRYGITLPPWLPS